MNVMEWADRHLAYYGDYADAVVCGRNRKSNGEMHRRSARFAAALLALDLKPNDRVVLWLPNGIEIVTGFTAAIRAGGASVVLSDATPGSVVARVLSHCHARFLIATPNLLKQLPDASRKDTIILVDDAREPRTGCTSVHWFENLIDEHGPLAEPIDRSPDDAAQIVYTSGTTGDPKAVAWTHRTISARYQVFADNRNPSMPARRSICVLPFSAAFGAQYLYLRHLQKMSLFVQKQFDPEAVLAAIEAHKIEAAMLVPSMCEALLAVPDAQRYDLRSLGSVLVGGAPVSSSLTQRFRKILGVRASTVYGLTELGPITRTLPGAAAGSVGKARDGVHIRVVDGEGRELARDQIGEIEIQADEFRADYLGPSVATDQQKAAQHEADSWFRTGDVGRLDPSGELWILGRSKEVIIQGGSNVYPQQIIDVIVDLPGVAECAVVGAPDQYLGEAVVACVRLDTPKTLTSDEIMAHCRARLDRRQLPARVLFVDALPKNELGKVSVATLKVMVESISSTVVNTELWLQLTSATATVRRAKLTQFARERLAAILSMSPAESNNDDEAGRQGAARDVRSAVDEERTFGELGLDSMGAVQFASSLAEAFGRSIPPTLVFNYPTIGQVCGFLENALFSDVKQSFGPIASRRGMPPATMQEPIAIVGVACRLPGGVGSPEQLLALLRERLDATAEIDRWNLGAVYDPLPGTPGRTYTTRAAFLTDVDAFDARFFGFNDREAAALDPQHRIVLEVAWHAIENAGYDVRDLSRCITGVCLGIGNSSYKGDPIGTQPAMAAGRLAHLLDLHGPVLSIDTACSSSLVAIETAVTKLRAASCDVVLAGGVNAICSADSFIGLSQVHALAADGRCKSFDADADGFGRGEGCVIFVLKRITDAERDGDRVLAVVRGAAVNHDGRTSSLTAPSGRAQAEVIRSALNDAGLSAQEVDYLEAHGTGTRLGDPIELEAAMQVFGARAAPLIIGSIKSNIGHLESAAGAAGLLKALLVLEHGSVPPQLHLQRLNPLLQDYADRFVIPTQPLPLPSSQGRRRVAGVTSMGLSGTNAHVVLEQGPAAAAGSALPQRAVQILCVSARNRAALGELVSAFAHRLDGQIGQDLANCCFTANTGRRHFEERVAVVGTTSEEIRERLVRIRARPAVRRKQSGLAFVFAGQGSQYSGMGRVLYEDEPVFRQAIDNCADLLAAELPAPLTEVMFADSGKEWLARTDVAQPALFALGYALTELWKSWGIVPDVVAGHSLGEYMAALAAGVFRLEDGLQLVLKRGRLMASKPGGGMLAAIIAPSTLQEEMAPWREQLQVAAINSLSNTVIAGELAALTALEAALSAKGIRCTRLRVSGAFHSRMMDSIVDEFRSEVARRPLSRPKIPFVSTVTGRIADEDLRDPEYWCRGLVEPVLFESTCHALVSSGAGVFLEIGPDAVLAPLVHECTAASVEGPWLASLRRGTSEPEQLMHGLADLYMANRDPAWGALYAGGKCRRVEIPNYPFQRTRYWNSANGGILATRRKRPDGIENKSPADRGAALRPSKGMDREDVRARLAALIVEVLAEEHAPKPRDNLIESGIDSLRMMELLSAIRTRFDVRLSPADFNRDPSLVGLEDRVMTSHAQALPPEHVENAASQLVVIRDGGKLAPLVCLHPAGGQVTAYMGLRKLLGDDRPILAIQSRAVSGTPEHDSIADMASAYASLIVDKKWPSVRLFGWSLGGIVAHAIARLVEHSGVSVEYVGMVDPPEPGTAPGIDPKILALLGIVYDNNPRPPRSSLLWEQVSDLANETVERLLSACEARSLLQRGALSPEQFRRTHDLYQAHAALVSTHVPRPIRAPLHVWWAAQRSSSLWSAQTSGAFREYAVGGTHFTIMQSSRLHAIAREL